ncbi:MAG: hypothetical protein KatS3mg015_2807 [Fimbriimonadales bacterium]|nr:MAG: hypothetical protein KatS3mg015_2807 [Fimbriimonadales bacterium]
MDIARGRDGATVTVAQVPFDRGFWKVEWFVEKWSEEAVDFARRKLLNRGVTKVEHGYEAVETGEMTWDNRLQALVPKIIVRPGVVAIEKMVPSHVLRKLRILPEEEETRHGNLLLNEGIQEMWDLIIGVAATSAYNNANAQLGVGSNTSAAAATQTDLQDAGAVWVGMNAGYPTRTNQTVDFRSDFGSGSANFAWQEWGVRNGATRNKNMNRKVESLGTKSGGTWTLTASITIS